MIFYVKNIKLGLRLWVHTKKEKKQGRSAAIDPFRGANGGILFYWNIQMVILILIK